MTRIREDMQKIRQIILKDGPQSWGQLRKKTGLTLSVLKDRIDLMIKRDEIMPNSGIEGGRRKTLYGLKNEEKSNAESGKYEAVNFIESLSNPVYKIEKTKNKRGSVTAFIGPVPVDQREKIQKKVNWIAKGASKGLGFISGKGLSHGQKIAVIFTVKG